METAQAGRILDAAGGPPRLWSGFISVLCRAARRFDPRYLTAWL